MCVKRKRKREREREGEREKERARERETCTTNLQARVHLTQGCVVKGADDRLACVRATRGLSILVIRLGFTANSAGQITELDIGTIARVQGDVQQAFGLVPRPAAPRSACELPLPHYAWPFVWNVPAELLEIVALISSSRLCTSPDLMTALRCQQAMRCHASFESLNACRIASKRL